MQQFKENGGKMEDTYTEKERKDRQRYRERRLVSHEEGICRRTRTCYSSWDEQKKLKREREEGVFKEKLIFSLFVFLSFGLSSLSDPEMVEMSGVSKVGFLCVVGKLQGMEELLLQQPSQSL